MSARILKPLAGIALALVAAFAAATTVTFDATAAREQFCVRQYRAKATCSRPRFLGCRPAR